MFASTLEIIRLTGGASLCIGLVTFALWFFIYDPYSPNKRGRFMKIGLIGSIGGAALLGAWLFLYSFGRFFGFIPEEAGIRLWRL